MLIGGLQKSSLVDYPGKICAIIFTQGCNFRCPYCHNPELVKPELFEKPIPEDEIFSFLKNRKGKLDAVEITGGEPTLQKDLLDFIRKIKDMGFLIKLDSNGTNPKIVKKAISDGIVDYLAMDVKAPIDKYSETVGVDVDTVKIKESIDLIMGSGLDYEFRTTIVKSLLSKDDIIKIGKLIQGAKNYFLQRFVPTKTLDERYMKEETYSDEDFEYIKNVVGRYVKNCGIR